MIDKPSTEGKPPKIKDPEGVPSERMNKKDDFESKKIFSDEIKTYNKINVLLGDNIIG